MAKNDDSRARNQIDQQGGIAQNNLNNLRTQTTVPQNQNLTNKFEEAATRNLGEYGGLQNNFQSVINANNANGPANVNADTVSLSRQPEINETIDRYRNFADTGGYSQQDQQDIRARSVNPLRSVYAGAIRDIDRAKTLGGGYAPNYIAARAKMSRELGQGVADANTSINANLAQMINAGKQFGVQGMGQISLADQGQALDASKTNAGNKLSADTFNANSKMKMQDQNLAAASGAANLYSATPGLTSTFGDQVLKSGDQRLQDQALQNQLGLGLINSQIDAGKLPGKSEGWLNTIGKVTDIGSKIFRPVPA